DREVDRVVAQRQAEVEPHPDEPPVNRQVARVSVPALYGPGDCEGARSPRLRWMSNSRSPGQVLPGASSFPGSLPYLFRTGIPGRHLLSSPTMTLGRLRAARSCLRAPDVARPGRGVGAPRGRPRGARGSPEDFFSKGTSSRAGGWQ